MMDNVSRRSFLRRVAGVSAAGVARAVVGSAETVESTSNVGVLTMGKPSVCVFSKYLQFLNYADLARTCKELGLDGIDLTVRKGGHVEPDTLHRDLPNAVDSIRAEGLVVSMITTNLNDGADPTAKPILEAASQHGIRYVRCGGLKYEKDGNPYDQLAGHLSKLRELSKMAEDLGLVLGYHNHSGMYNVGAPLWDLLWLVREIGSDSFGSNFDVGHACIEGGLGAWEINARVLAQYVKMMAVKDYLWENKELQWVSLGSGQAKLVETLKIMRDAGFAGPISLHIEYKTPSRDALLDEIRQSVVVLRRYLEEAGFSA